MSWHELLDGLDNDVGAAEDEIDELHRRYPRLESDYLEFLRRKNGATGSVGERYIALWSIEDLAELNEAYAVSEFAPGLLLIGTDGGNEGFGFDLRNTAPPIVQVPLVGMDWLEATHVAANFAQFIEWLASTD